MPTPSVFISYSHHDQELVGRLIRHLKVLEYEDVLRVWVDHSVDAGESWIKQIEEAIDSASVVVLLISADFLSSDFAVTKEIPRLLEKRSRGEAILMPVISRPCSWHNVSWLRPLQVWPKDSVPLSEQDRIDETLAAIVEEIRTNVEAAASSKRRAKRIESARALRKVEPRGNTSRQKVFISRCEEDGDFGDLLKSRLEAEGFTARADEDCLGVGMDWRGEIDQAIRESSALIVVMTPEARKSEYVTYEWAFAIGAGIPVIPVMLKPTQFHPRLEALQFLDFTNRKARPWSELIESLRWGLIPGTVRSSDKKS